MLTVFGSVAFDTIRTKSKVLKNVLGGAATYAAIASSYFAKKKPGLVAVVGKDFPKKYHNLLGRYLDLKGLAVENGKTFRYDGSYDENLSHRTTNKTELNVLGKFNANVPEEYRKSRYVYLANNDPKQNTRIIDQFDNVKFSMCDTIDFWISTKRAEVIKMIKKTDCVVMNDEEAKLLTKHHNLVKCAKKIMEYGSKYVVIKKGEHGSLLFHGNEIFSLPGFATDKVVDPTGAGDCFAGGMMGYIEKKDKTNASTLKEAIVFGNVMGSLNVQRYATDGITKVNKNEIQKRFREYKKMINF